MTWVIPWIVNNELLSPTNHSMRRMMNPPVKTEGICFTKLLMGCRKLTWNPKTDGLWMFFLFQGAVFRFRPLVFWGGMFFFASPRPSRKHQEMISNSKTWRCGWNAQPLPSQRYGTWKILHKIDWAVLIDEQMSNRWPFSLLNDEQMSNKVRVEHQPVDNDSLAPEFQLFFFNHVACINIHIYISTGAALLPSVNDFPDDFVNWYHLMIFLMSSKAAIFQFAGSAQVA